MCQRCEILKGELETVCLSLNSEIILEGGAPDFARPTSRLELDGTYSTAGFPDPEGRAVAPWRRPSPPNYC